MRDKRNTYGIMNIAPVDSATKVDYTPRVGHGSSTDDHVPVPWQAEATANIGIFGGVLRTAPKDNECPRCVCTGGSDRDGVEINIGFRFEEEVTLRDPQQVVLVVIVSVGIHDRGHSDKVASIFMNAK